MSKRLSSATVGSESVDASRSQPTIRDVSKRAGVSTATVSRVLSGLGGASEGTRRKIEQVVRELGYRPNRMARDLRATRSKLIGVAIPDLQNPFFTGVVSGVEEVLQKAGFTTFLANSGEDMERERRELEALRTERVSGVLLIPCSTRGENYAELVNSGVPMVTVDRALEGVSVDCVTSANEAGAYEAVAQLARYGYPSIGMVNGPACFGVARDRELGFLRAMETFGLEVRADWVASGDFSEDSGYEAMRRILEVPERPRAIFVSNFLMALGALRALHERRLRIPEEVALMTFDDMPWASAMNPALSTVAQPVRELGRTAASLLLERMADSARPVRTIVLDTELVLRQSCGTQGGGALS